ncbi:MAG: glycerophosphodiester phosphodiesterase family protein [Bacteroidia bacterium]
MQTVIYGHRGARGVYPENTMEGFLYAVALGIYGIEMDVVISKDKKVIVSHEPWMNPRICTKPDNSKISFLRRKRLYRMNYAAIRQYDCGLRGNPDFPGQKKIPAYKPLLSEVITAVESFTHNNNIPPVVYNIEIKSKWVNDYELQPPPEEFVEIILNELLPFNINHRILLQSFDMRPLNILHSKNTGCMTGMLVKNPRLLRSRMLSLSFTPDTCGIYYKYASKKWINIIHDLGMKALVWTENEKEDMREHIALGIDGIITDYPQRAIEVMNELPK